MATISIADNDARVQYTQAVTADVTQLTIDFPFFGIDNINVIATTSAGVDTVLTRGTGTGTFAVNGTAVDDGFSGGNVTLGDNYANTFTFTVFRDIAVARTTDFPTSGPFNVSSLNTELDRITAIEQELETKISRTMGLADSDASAALSLPNLNTRKGTVLAFNETSGLPEAGPSIDSVASVSAQSANINTVAGISGNITTVAGISANVTSVAGVSSSVATVAGIASNVTTVAGVASNVTTVAGISADVTAVANIASDISAVENIKANVTTVAGIQANVTTVAGISTNVTTVAGNTSNIATVVANITDIQNAEENALLAKNYSIKVDGAVAGGNYSSKAWAIGGTGVTDTAGSGAAKEWATETSSNVDGTEYSAKEYSIGTGQNTGMNTGSAKQWALGGGNSFSISTTVDGTNYSAKYWADQAASSVANFDDKYYGNYSTDALAEDAHEAAGYDVHVGDLYFNTTTNVVRYCQVAPTGVGAPVGTWADIATQDLSNYATAGFSIAMSIAL